MKTWKSIDVEDVRGSRQFDEKNTNRQKTTLTVKLSEKLSVGGESCLANDCERMREAVSQVLERLEMFNVNFFISGIVGVQQMFMAEVEYTINGKMKRFETSQETLHGATKCALKKTFNIFFHD